VVGFGCAMPPRMASEGYIHGYSREEQERLVGQAEYWRDSLILPAVRARAGESLLEVGCGAGAVLGVIAGGCPGVKLAGIDLAPEQIAYARRHLGELGRTDVDLRQGDATRLPWEDASFDHVFMMWFLEHLFDPAPFLAEARRVLRPGGTITAIETDYSTFLAFPTDPDLDALMAAQRELFRRNGQPAIGRQLGTLLAASGFRRVESGPVGFHHFAGAEGTGLRDFARYLLGFLEPMVPRAARELGLDEGRLRAGAAFLAALPGRPMASLTQLVFRAWAVR
jgi:ubiquinone/menaquinone biosynthesis C-methylase UbiE